MKPIATIKLFGDYNTSRTGLLDDFLDSDSDSEDSFACSGQERVTTKTTNVGAPLPASFASENELPQMSLEAVAIGSCKDVKGAGIVENLRTSLMKAKQVSFGLKKQCSMRSLFSTGSTSHTELECEEISDQIRVGELVNREVLVKQQKAVNLEIEDTDFVRELNDLRKCLSRQQSDKLRRPTKEEERMKKTLKSCSAHARFRGQSEASDDGQNYSNHVHIGDFSAIHIKASAGVLPSRPNTTSRRSGNVSTRNRPRRHLSRSKSDPSDIEKMVFGLQPTSDSRKPPNDIAGRRCGVNRGRRILRRNKSANAQDLLGLQQELKVSGDNESSQISDLSLDLGPDSIRRHDLSRSTNPPRTSVPLSIACDSETNYEFSSRGTVPTELDLSDVSDAEGGNSDGSGKSGVSVDKKKSPTANEPKAFQPRRIRRTDPMPLVNMVPSKKSKPVELPNFSSHKSEKADHTTTEKETFVFDIDSDRPFLKSRHRDTSEYLQLNISNHSLLEGC